MNLKIKGFTLIELIVSITILVFLSAIGYIKYTSYISSTRDTSRYSKLKEISDLLKTYEINKTLPAPINFIEVKAKGEIIGYQGYAGADLLDKIHYSSEGKDPDDDKYFTYYITSDRKSFQLLGFYENKDSLNISSIFNFNKLFASNLDYSSRFPIVVGDKIGILTTEQNKPIQEVKQYISNGYVDLSGVNKNDIFKAYITNDRIYKFKGKILASKLYSITKKSKYLAPRVCPKGYISVWGDVDFNQPGFCVAKYEMTFSEKDSPGTPTNSSYNAYNYVAGKYYKSRADYPVVNLTQEEAINACKKLGKGYHLITNNEWMTIARQIEFEKENWKNENPGYDDTLFTGNSNYSVNGCKDSTGPKSKGTKTGDGDPSCFYKRKNILFNGEIIWDFAGNVTEHVNKANTKSGSGFDNGKTSIGSSSNCFVEWNTLNSSVISSYGSLFGQNSVQGIGGVCNPSGVNDNVFTRGGSYGATSNAGIYNLVLNKTNSSSKQDYIGFRCAR